MIITEQNPTAFHQNQVFIASDPHIYKDSDRKINDFSI